MSECMMLVEGTGALDEQIEIRSRRVAELKEALKAGAGNMNSEMLLLGELSQEINAVRRLREARFLRRELQPGLEIAPIHIDLRGGASRIHTALM